jgi:hypothetical protein
MGIREELTELLRKHPEIRVTSLGADAYNNLFYFVNNQNTGKIETVDWPTTTCCLDLRMIEAIKKLIEVDEGEEMNSREELINLIVGNRNRLLPEEVEAIADRIIAAKWGQTHVEIKQEGAGGSMDEAKMEVIAKAIYASTYEFVEAYPWDTIDEYEKREYLRMAEAAIKAMAKDKT